MTVTDQGESVAVPSSSDAATLTRTFLDLMPKLSREEQKDFFALVDEYRKTGTNKKRNLDRFDQELKDVDEGGNQLHFPFRRDAWRNK
jgi:hypothetical protein